MRMRGFLGSNFRHNLGIRCEVDDIRYENTVSMRVINDNTKHTPEPHSGHLDVFSVVTLNHRTSWESAGAPVHPTIRSVSCIKKGEMRKKKDEGVRKSNRVEAGHGLRREL